MKGSIKDVIENDYCIGCGICAFHNKSSFTIQLDKFGMLKANMSTNEISNEELIEISALCPFSDYIQNEDSISEKIFTDVKTKDPYLGKYIQNYVGYVEEGDYREKGSSGGMGKWLINQLFVNEEIDYAIQVVNQKVKGELYTYQVFTKDDNILEGAKSAYYPISLEETLTFIINNEGRYVVTTVPCFSKALRNYAEKHPILKERIKYTIGIICGHLKSTGFAESFAWQLGVEPKNLKGIEFRDKIPGRKANEKGVFAEDTYGNKTKVVSSRDLLGGNWGHNMFKYKACDYCDDIVGETTDVSIGDAWLKDLMDDDKGNNVVVVRNRRIGKIIAKGISDGKLNLKAVSPEVINMSQAGGIRHRREGLAYRLKQKSNKGLWAPEKRVDKNLKVSRSREKIYKVREDVRDASHEIFFEAKRRNDLIFFKKNILKEIKKFEPSNSSKIIHKIKSTIIKLIK
ncbi:Coenzyme F420 hydrogenase/dehydrogenase, beta subunit C-terminal domain [Pontibacter sp. HSC-14F20]|uniref:Coenzyme F420 hydrogenase/dehydrogenase, beta subunit C-terminal domain n=1 Tax=Pontibacter sp. HSC-14F20 TaxID=2864136 RepID=UPI001C72E75D|nr:Coenzyme F420 hydrogenase/dehydrogenase, beta subunit C-terminal domain [Pontibacter sp. HSC-14F20]MBX0333241.1 Coenzyme F420 hydrogenase/dehydrogenase, beta subunit C-terminal domain [Pontibacter sp. HSC-14F20]